MNICGGAKDTSSEITINTDIKTENQENNTTESQLEIPSSFINIADAHQMGDNRTKSTKEASTSVDKQIIKARRRGKPADSSTSPSPMLSPTQQLSSLNQSAVDTQPVKEEKSPEPYLLQGAKISPLNLKKEHLRHNEYTQEPSKGYSSHHPTQSESEKKLLLSSNVRTKKGSSGAPGVKTTFSKTLNVKVDDLKKGAKPIPLPLSHDQATSRVKIKKQVQFFYARYPEQGFTSSIYLHFLI